MFVCLFWWLYSALTQHVSYRAENTFESVYCRECSREGNSRMEHTLMLGVNH